MVAFLTQTTVCGFSLYQTLAYFLIYSCLGWCLEVVYAAVTTGKLVNRGFLNGPVCPIYGFGMILVLFFLTPLEDDLFRDSLEYFPASGYDIEWMTYDLHENEPEWNIRTEHEGMFTEMGIKIKALIARKKPGDDSVTWIEPKVLKRMAREAAEAEAAAKAAQEGESNV